MKAELVRFTYTDPWWVAYAAPPGASSHGRSRREALENLLETSLDMLYQYAELVSHIDDLLQENGHD